MNKGNIKEQKRRNRERRTARKHEFVLLHLSSHPCVDCGETDPVVLEFDHVRGIKKTTVSAAMGSWCSIARLYEEIEKCEVRCANCHRRKHSKDQSWYKFLGV